MMLNELARAQLAGFAKALDSDPKLTIPLGTLRHFLGAAAIEDIKVEKSRIAADKKAFKKAGASNLSAGAQEYWRRFKMLRLEADRGTNFADEKRLGIKSERLRDDFEKLVPLGEEQKFRIHSGTEKDEADWDFRWDLLEGRPPLLKDENKADYPIVSPMNYAQLAILAPYVEAQVVPDEQKRQADDRITHSRSRMRRFADPDATVVVLKGGSA